MLPLDELGMLPYVGILVAAAVEGEAVFLAAAALVASGQLHPGGVCLAGAIGSALGDQFYFYAMRRHLSRLLDRLPVGRLRHVLAEMVRRHETWAIAAVRFAPGFRVALTAVCVDAGVTGWRFSLINTAMSVVWAVGLMGAVGYAGPQALSSLGLPPWAAALASGVAMLLAATLVARRLRHQWQTEPGATARADPSNGAVV